MTAERAQALVDRYLEYSGTHDATALSGLFAEDGVIESPSLGTHRGRSAIEQGYRRWFESFPDLQVTAEHVVVSGAGDEVSLTVRLTGTHLEDFFGLEPTGKRIQFQLVFLQSLRDGEIQRERRVYDFSGLLIKLGMLKVKPA